MSRPLSSTTVQGSKTSSTSARSTKPLPSLCSVRSPDCAPGGDEGVDGVVATAGAFSSGSGEKMGSRSMVRLGWACGSVRSRVGIVGVEPGGTVGAWAEGGAWGTQQGAQQMTSAAGSTHRDVRELDIAIAGIHTFDCLRETNCLMLRRFTVPIFYPNA